MNAKYRVSMWESERGWGTKHWDDVDFDTYDEALAFMSAENAKNNSSVAPDWYVYADAPKLVDADREPPRRG